MIAQMQQQMQMGDPIKQAELIRAEAKLVEAESKQNIEAAKIDQKNQQFIADMAARLTELELKYSQNVPGSIV